MNAESIIKGRMAGLIVSLMLQEAGYSVFRYGYEGIPETLAQIGTLKKKNTLNLLASTPHFVVTDKKREEVFLVGIKFQAEGASGRSIPWGLAELVKFWPYADLLVVRTVAPFFFVLQQKEGCAIKTIPLNEGVLKVSSELIKKYGQLARKFLA